MPPPISTHDDDSLLGLLNSLDDDPLPKPKPSDEPDADEEAPEDEAELDEWLAELPLIDSGS